jgi:hypothetical protein
LLYRPPDPDDLDIVRLTGNDYGIVIGSDADTVAVVALDASEARYLAMLSAAPNN